MGGRSAGHCIGDESVRRAKRRVDGGDGGWPPVTFGDATSASAPSPFFRPLPPAAGADERAGGAARRIHASAFTFSPFSNPWILLGVGLTLLCQAVFTYVPFMQDLFRTA
ncbi:MAG: hypothetical protein FJ399_15155, partial [Verrucomicrobia bacterium]|nr:hypothetical protein [Verrucomicrobiota bacterium]